MSNNRKSDYNKLGFLSPIDVLSEEQAMKHRQNMEDVEQQIGPVHYMAKMHTILRSPYDLVVHPNIQYIAPHVRQTKLPGYSALLVRGVDRFQHYEEETPATRDLDPAALAWRKQQDQLHFSIAGTS
jgi:hypothetical protein